MGITVTRKLPADISSKRLELKEQLIYERKKCENSDCPNPNGLYRLDLHEGIVSRTQIKKVRNRQVLELIYLSPVNLLILHHECHLFRCPTREETLLIALNRGNKEELIEFFDKLSYFEKSSILKARLPRPKNINLIEETNETCTEMPILR